MKDGNATGSPRRPMGGNYIEVPGQRANARLGFVETKMETTLRIHNPRATDRNGKIPDRSSDVLLSFLLGASVVQRTHNEHGKDTQQTRNALETHTQRRRNADATHTHTPHTLQLI